MVPNEQVLSEKSEVISKIKSRIEDSRGIYFFDYRGLSVQKLNNLRVQLRESGAKATVFKNTYIRRALNDLNYDCPESVLKEPTVLLSCEDDIVSPAKVLVDFVKDNGIGLIKGGYLGDKAIDLNEVTRLSKLPTRHELLTQLVGTLNAPISNFVIGLSGVSRNLVCVLSAIKSQKDGGN